jgi:hypothetical protein
VKLFVALATRFYEQSADSNGAGRYVKRWVQWAKSGIWKSADEKKE